METGKPIFYFCKLYHSSGGDERGGRKSTRTAVKRTFLGCPALCSTTYSLTKYQTIKFKVHGLLFDFAQADKILADEKLEGQKKVTTVNNLPENRSDLLLQDKIQTDNLKLVFLFIFPNFSQTKFRPHMPLRRRNEKQTKLLPHIPLTCTNVKLTRV